MELLVEYGFLYDASMMATDFAPYYVRLGDKWNDTDPYQFGAVSDLVELPWGYELDDFVVFAHVWGTLSGLRTAADVEALWREEFEFAYNHCPGGVFVVTMHPQVIGRGTRITMLQRLIDDFTARNGVAWGTMCDAARSWKRANPVNEWSGANPALTGANAILEFPRRRDVQD